MVKLIWSPRATSDLEDVLRCCFAIENTTDSFNNVFIHIVYTGCILNVRSEVS